MGQLLNASAVLMCPHGGSVSAVSTNTRAKAGGDFILRPSDVFIIAGCPFVIPGVGPHPCMKVQWVVSGLRTKAAGDNVLTSDSVGLCVAADNAPQGTVMITVTQPQVSGQ